jgi:hypothetical protein
MSLSGDFHGVQSLPPARGLRPSVERFIQHDEPLNGVADTPQLHAQQLGALADRTSHNAACMTLYLGKLALMLPHVRLRHSIRISRSVESL